MNKKYSSGNYFINSTFDSFTYNLNVNETNNKLINSTNLFPYSKSRYLNLYLCFLGSSIDTYRYNIYYSFVYDSNTDTYTIYNYKGDYELATFLYDDEESSVFKSNSFEIYKFLDANDLDYKLVDVKNSIVFFFYNNNYPYQIEYPDGRNVTINFTNNKINKITCYEEEINFVYNNGYTDIILSKKYNNQITIISSRTRITNNNSNSLNLSFNVYQYDDINYSYIDSLVSEYDITYSSNTLNINNNINDTNISFVYNNSGKVVSISLDNGNLRTTNITYQGNITYLTENDDSLRLIYNSDNMLKYSIKNDKYIKYYRYNNSFLLEYESEYVKNESIINDILSNFGITTFEPDDEYDDFDYSFSINQVYNQTIPSHLSSFISSNDIYHAEGYGELYYNLDLYGEEYDDLSLFVFTKSISGYAYLELRYFGGEYGHTSITKQIISGQDFEPFIIGLKPSYSYDKVNIKIFINGELYLNTPKLTKTHMGCVYSYNNSKRISSICTNEGVINITYNGIYVSSISTPKMTRTFTRDNHGNILTDSIDGFEITRTYNTRNRILTEASEDSTVSYTYGESYLDGMYSETTTIEEAANRHIEYTYDNYGNEIKKIEFFNSTTIDEKKYYYDAKKLTGIIHTNNNTLLYLYDNEDNLVQMYDSVNTKYDFVWQNNKINDVKYNVLKYIDKKTYDNRDRILTEEFNGVYSYEYLTNPKKINVYYNNILKYELDYNNYDYLVSDGYNNYEYDNNDIIKKDTIFNKDFKYYKNSIGYNNQTANYLNYTYMDNKFGDNKLKDDVYYGNIIYNLDSDISSVNSSNTTIMKYEDNFYPLSSNLLSIYGDSPISFLKQEYKLFYYDKNINNYATLLYGTKIRYNTNIGSTGQIRLQFKLENRNIDQLIIRLQSNYRDIYIYRNSSGFLVIRDNIGDQTESTAILILSSVWYKMIIQIDDSLLTTKITFESTSTYVYQTMNIGTPQNDNNLKIQLGKMDYYYAPMVTYGLIRNLFYSQSLSEDRDYINIYKSDSMMLNNEIKNTEIKINKDKVLSIDRIILKEQPREFDPNSNIYEKRSLSVNNNDYVFETYSFRDICYENHISITDDMIYSFEYDSRYRIIKEKVYINSNESYNYSYSYDNNENIVSWSHTAGNNVIKSILYNYNNQYKMILDSIIITENNQAVLYQLTYDNTTGMLPVSFMGNSYSYEGYNLITYNSYNYEYNVYGKRIRKYNSNINMNVYYYYDKNNNLIIEDGISYKLKFLYDCSNNLYGFVYDTTNNWSFSNNIYLYLKDETGIIWGIVDSSGNLVGKYNYNAYGYIISVTDYDQSSIVNINPIRYKSYYYDTESNMYYLSSRYYNPLLARFMTPDSFENVEKTGEKTYNLYAYCFNNPTSFVDSEGNFAILAARLAIIYFTSKELEKQTRKTIEKIEKMEYKTDDNNVTIIDSYKISSPFEIFIGAFYFKYIKKETKGIIKGSVLASTFEWMIHNMAYQIGFEKEPAKDVSLGPTIFDDNHGFLSFLMCSSYILVTRNFSVSDILINLILKITGM